ncbi:MAG TPA: anaerobic ribonucleoside-triphosphate reductase activating protein [Atribacteraceae bacterium]|nr:anaerobic ribonucleoside-triphosphate reductase activating protein [Atribacteraceae bacterium]
MFYGWQKVSLIEYPGHIATVLFTGGCNFRCPYCHNPSFAFLSPGLPPLPEKTILTFLAARHTMVDAVVLTGGEPLLHAAHLKNFLERVKALGFLVKMDTNGSFPDEFSRLNRSNLIDRWGIDFKIPFERYAALTTIEAGTAVRQTLGEALQTPDRLEIRTTLYPPSIDRETLLEMSDELSLATHWFWQNFRNETTLAPVARTVIPYSRETILTWQREIDRKMGREFVVVR